MDVLRLTLRQLQIFVAVARSGSTMAAGEDIALSQSATSAAVNELERLLSLRLFDRAGKRLLLNDNGRALLPQAQALLDGAGKIEAMARNADAQLQALRIGASTTIGNCLLPRLLAGFLAGRHHAAPDWHSRVAIGNTATISAGVAAFELDLGLIEGPCHDAALEAHPWRQDEMVVVAAPDHPLIAACPAPDAARDALRDAVWLLREPGSGTRETTDQALLPHLGAYRRTIALGSSEAIRHAAAENLGVACLSRWVVEESLLSGKLCRVDPGWPPITRQCYWIVRRGKALTPALAHLIGELDVAGGRPAGGGTVPQ